MYFNYHTISKSKNQAVLLPKEGEITAVLESSLQITDRLWGWPGRELYLPPELLQWGYPEGSRPQEKLPSVCSWQALHSEDWPPRETSGSKNYHLWKKWGLLSGRDHVICDPREDKAQRCNFEDFLPVLLPLGTSGKVLCVSFSTFDLRNWLVTFHRHFRAAISSHSVFKSEQLWGSCHRITWENRAFRW